MNITSTISPTQPVDDYYDYYQKFYPRAVSSPTHSRFCEMVFGKDLTQEGQTDMESLHALLELVDPKSGESLIDLGCGAGIISEYIANSTGVSVTGIDYAEPAIAEARMRTARKGSQLQFWTEDFNTMELKPNSYDIAISIDTLYVDDMKDVLSRIIKAVKPGGRIGIFLNHFINPGNSKKLLAPEHSDVSRAFSNLGIQPEIYDYNKKLKEFWSRLRSASFELKDEFVKEGNAFIPENYIHEADDDHIPEIEAGRLARYLYIARI